VKYKYELLSVFMYVGKFLTMD